MTPYEKGRIAQSLGKTRDANPYTHETSIQSKNFREWVRGFNERATEDMGAADIAASLGRRRRNRDELMSAALS